MTIAAFLVDGTQLCKRYRGVFYGFVDSLGVLFIFRVFRRSTMLRLALKIR